MSWANPGCVGLPSQAHMLGMIAHGFLFKTQVWYVLCTRYRDLKVRECMRHTLTPLRAGPDSLMSRSPPTWCGPPMWGRQSGVDSSPSLPAQPAHCFLTKSLSEHRALHSMSLTSASIDLVLHLLCLCFMHQGLRGLCRVTPEHFILRP